MVECEGTPPPGTVIRDGKALLRNLIAGDVFHASGPGGASLVGLITAVTETTEARTVTHQMHLQFDRETGGAEWNAAKQWPGKGHADEWGRSTIDSVAPLPVDAHKVMQFVDRKFRLAHLWDDVALSDAEKHAFAFVDSRDREHPI